MCLKFCEKEEKNKWKEEGGGRKVAMSCLDLELRTFTPQPWIPLQWFCVYKGLYHDFIMTCLMSPYIGTK